MQNELDRSRSKSLPWRVEEAYAAEVELERARWAEITAFVELFTARGADCARLLPEPGWSVKDLIAHLGAWMAEARVQLLDIAARSYMPHEVEVAERNAATLAATKAEPWERVGRGRPGHEPGCWRHGSLSADRDDAANQWVRKAGAEHYGEHLGRLRDWVAEIIDLRTRPKAARVGRLGSRGQKGRATTVRGRSIAGASQRSPGMNRVRLNLLANLALEGAPAN